MLDTGDLRYLEAQHVRCPAGQLAGFRVRTHDDKPLGTVAGVLISRAARRLAYLVIESPGLFVHRRYALPLGSGAVVQEDAKVLHIPVRKDELSLEVFRAGSVRRFADEDLLNVMFGREAA